MARFLLLLLLVTAFAVGASLSYFNWHEVRVDYLAGEASLPMVVLLLGAFLIGGLLAWLGGLGRHLGQRLEIRRLTRRVSDTERELKSLRDLPPAAAPATPVPTETRSPDA